MQTVMLRAARSLLTRLYRYRRLSVSSSEISIRVCRSGSRAGDACRAPKTRSIAQSSSRVCSSSRSRTGRFKY